MPFVLDTDVVIDRVIVTVNRVCLTALIWKVRLSVLLPEGVPDCVSSLDSVIGAFWRAMASAFWRAMASAFWRAMASAFWRAMASAFCLG